jgi:hypothetical protein
MMAFMNPRRSDEQDRDLSVPAQDAPQPAVDLAARFRQYDRDGDGKVRAEEAAPYPGVKRLIELGDTDRDGALSLGEYRAVAGRLSGTAGEASTPGIPQPAPPGPRMASQDFTVEDLPLTAPGSAVSDPEFCDALRRVTYWDYSEPGNAKVLVRELDPVTGLFAMPPGRDDLVAEHVSPFSRDGKWWAHNGPEWGCDRNGWAVYFTKEDAQGTRQLWRATRNGARHEAQQLATLSGGACGGLYTQDPGAVDTGPKQPSAATQCRMSNAELRMMKGKTTNFDIRYSSFDILV